MADDPELKKRTDPATVPGEAAQPGALEGEEPAADAGEDIAIELPLEPGDGNAQPG